MGDQLVVSEHSGPVAWLRMNRPDAMNSLNNELLDQLNAALDSVENDPSVHVVVLTGTARAFCAGADLKEIAADDGSIDADKLLTFVDHAAATIQRFPALTKPVIAAINGLALAGGMELMMACDLVIAAQGARIGDAHSNYGLLPGGGGAARLARLAGPLVAKYLAFTGDFLPASELLPLGLVNEVVPDDELHSRAEQLAQRIASKSASGLSHMKRLIDEGLDQPLANALRMEQDALAVHVHSDDLREGLNAFREKRHPHFTSS